MLKIYSMEKLSDQVIRDPIRSFLNDEYQSTGVLPVDFSDDFPLVETGILNSIGVFNLILFLEKKFKIQIAVEDLTKASLESLSAIERLVKRKLSQGAV